MEPTGNVVPDGGWGWVIVAAVAFINMTNQAIPSVFGQLFGSELKRMQQATFTAALITNLHSSALNFSGLFIGPAIKSFKPRNVAASGCVLVAFGLILCSFATESWHFIIGYSFSVGLGLGLISPSTFMVVNSYFNHKRGFAVGIGLAGAGVGQVLLPHLVRFFLDNYDFRTAVLALSLLASTGFIGALFLKPLPQKEQYNNRQLLQPKLIDDNNKAQQELSVVVVNDKVETYIVSNASTSSKLCSKICHRLVQAMDLALLQDIVFWSIIVGIALVYTSTVNFTMLFPSFLQYSVGLTSTNTAHCMSIVAAADVISRLILPCITDRLRIPYRIVFLLGTVALFITRSALAESLELPTIIAMCILTGMAKSATILNNNLCISGHVSAAKLPGGLGLNMLSKALLVISVGQLLGWIRDYTDSYVVGLHAQNLLLLFVVVVWTPEIYYRYRAQKRKSKSEQFTDEATHEELAKFKA